MVCVVFERDRAVPATPKGVSQRHAARVRARHALDAPIVCRCGWCMHHAAIHLGGRDLSPEQPAGEGQVVHRRGLECAHR